VAARFGDEESNGRRHHDRWPVTPDADLTVDFCLFGFLPFGSLGLDQMLSNRKVELEG